MLGAKGAFCMLCVFCLSLAAAAPACFWSGQGLWAALWGRGPAFGPAAPALLWLCCAGLALAWLYWPAPAPGPDALLEQTKTKALLPDEWRGELCSSIVSNQS